MPSPSPPPLSVPREAIPPPLRPPPGCPDPPRTLPAPPPPPAPAPLPPMPAPSVPGPPVPTPRSDAPGPVRAIPLPPPGSIKTPPAAASSCLGTGVGSIAVANGARSCDSWGPDCGTGDLVAPSPIGPAGARGMRSSVAVPEGGAAGDIPAVSLTTSGVRLGPGAFRAFPGGEDVLDFPPPPGEESPAASPVRPPGGETDGAIVSVTRRARRVRRLTGGLATLPTRRTSPRRRNPCSRQDAAIHRDHGPPGRHFFRVRPRRTCASASDQQSAIGPPTPYPPPQGGEGREGVRPIPDC